MPTTRKGWIFLLAILSAAMLIRGTEIVRTRESYVPIADASHFDLTASWLINGKGFGPTLVPTGTGPSAFRGPVYPLILAGVYSVFGDHSGMAGRLVTSAFGVAVVALIGLLAAMLLGKRVAAVALVLAAFHPLFVMQSTGLYLESVLVTCALGALIAALHYHQHPRGWWWPVAAGALAALAILTREPGLFVLPPVVLLLWRRGMPWRSALVAPLLAVASVVVVMAPWTIRNAVRLGGFTPVTTGGGYSLAGTYSEAARHRDSPFPALWLPPIDDPEMRKVMVDLKDHSEVSIDKALRKEGLDYIRANPEWVPQVMFWNTLRLYDLQGTRYALFQGGFTGYSRRQTILSVYASYGLYALTIAGLIVLRSVRRIPFAVWLCPILATIGFAFITASTRYRASIEPFFMLSAAAFIVWGFDRVRTRRTDSGVAPA